MKVGCIVQQKELRKYPCHLLKTKGIHITTERDKFLNSEPFWHAMQYEMKMKPKYIQNATRWNG